MGTSSLRFVPLALLVAACVGPPPEIGALEQAVGEPMNGFPSPEERLVLELVNRGRSDPSVVKGSSSTIYPAVAPVAWAYDFNRSSRFHSTNLVSTGVTLMHTSPCTLNTNVATAGCDGTRTCACATAVPSMCAGCNSTVGAINTCGTDTFTRIGYFTAAGAGESARGECGAAGGLDPVGAVNLWLDEAAGSDGHRQILLDVSTGSQNVMGFGYASGSPCWGNYYFGDTGTLSTLSVPKLPTAAVNPVRGAAGTFRVYATWHDGAGAPSLMDAVVDGACTPMAKELGSPTLNATYFVDASLAAGCHTYWILAHDAGGARLTYPTTGALTISVGGVACSADYVATAPTASCEGGAASDMNAAVDAAAPPPDATAARDATTLVDATAAPDLRKTRDAATTITDATVTPRDATAAPDLVVPNDLTTIPADMTGVPVDATALADLTIASGDGGGGASDASSATSDLASASSDGSVTRRDGGGTSRDGTLAGADGSTGGATPDGCSCDVAARRSAGPRGTGATPLAAIALGLALALSRRRRARAAA